MYPINYRGGWMQPVAEYVPEVRKSRPTWKSNSKLPDYGPVIDEAPRPRQSFEDRAKSYQKIQYSEPFHTATPVIEFVNEPHVLDPIKSNENNIKAPAQSSLREPLHFHDTYDNQDTTERDWRQKKLKGITNISNLGNFVDKLWNDVQKAKSTNDRPKCLFSCPLRYTKMLRPLTLTTLRMNDYTWYRNMFLSHF